MSAGRDRDALVRSCEPHPARERLGRASLAHERDGAERRQEVRVLDAVHKIDVLVARLASGSCSKACEGAKEKSEKTHAEETGREPDCGTVQGGDENLRMLVKRSPKVHVAFSQPFERIDLRERRVPINLSSLSRDVYSARRGAYPCFCVIERRSRCLDICSSLLTARAGRDELSSRWFWEQANRVHAPRRSHLCPSRR